MGGVNETSSTQADQRVRAELLRMATVTTQPQPASPGGGQKGADAGYGQGADAGGGTKRARCAAAPTAGPTGTGPIRSASLRTRAACLAARSAAAAP